MNQSLYMFAILLIGCAEVPAADADLWADDLGRDTADSQVAPPGTSATTASDSVACKCDTPSLLGTCSSYVMAEPSVRARNACQSLQAACPAGGFERIDCDINDFGRCIVTEIPGVAAATFTYYDTTFTASAAEANCNTWGGTYYP